MLSSQPDYYKKNGLSPMDAFKEGLLSMDEYKGFIKGNIIKYVVRAESKGTPVKDLLKAKEYINFYLELFSLSDDELKELNKLVKEAIEGLNDEDKP